MKTPDTPAANDCPAEVLGWIPWYPDGLEEAQRGAVEAHAAACAACRDELEMLQGVVEPDAVPEPERVYARVLARMEATRSADAPAEARGGATVSQLPVRPREDEAEEEPRGWQRISIVTGTRGLAIAAGLLLALAIGSVLGSQRTDEPLYETATASGVDVAAAPVASLDVVFREGASAREINEVLRDVGARITSGPSSLGVYRLELPTGANWEVARERLTREEGGIATFAEKPLGR